MALGSAGLQWYFNIAKKYLALESLGLAVSDELQTLIGVPPPHQPHHPLEVQCLQMIGLMEAPLKERPDVAILACLTKITQ
jgi:hypothetical protein